MSEDVKKILQMLQDGKITADEAEKLIDALTTRKKVENEPIQNEIEDKIENDIEDAVAKAVEETSKKCKSTNEARKAIRDTIRDTIRNTIRQKVRQYIVSSSENKDELGKREYSFSDVKNLLVNLASGDIQISNSSNEEVEVSISGKHTIKQENSNLKLQVASGDAEIVIPEDVESTIQIGSGDVELDNVSCESLQLTVGSGDIDGELECDEIKISVGSGDVELSIDEFESAVMKIGSGDVSLETPENTIFKIDMSFGSQLELPDETKILEDIVEEKEKDKKRRKLVVQIGKSTEREMSLVVGTGDISIQ